MRVCTPGPITPEPVIITKVDTVWVQGKDSIVYAPPVTKYIPGKTKYIPVDTAAILKDYFAKVLYSDSIKIDSFGYVYVRDTISENRIQNRTTVLDYKLPIVNKTTTIFQPYKPKLQIYSGFDLVVGPPTGLTYAGIDISLKNKKDQFYTIGVGVNPSGGIQYKFGTQWKIKIK